MDVMFSVCRIIIVYIQCILLKLFYRGVNLNKCFGTLYLPSIRVRKKGSVSIKNAKFRRGCSIFSDGGVVEIGHSTFFNNGCSLSAQGKIIIGEHCLFGENVKLYDHNHLIENGVVSHSKFISKDIIIGNDCWIGSNCVILPGIRICDRVTIGAGCIITKSIDQPGVYVSNSSQLRKIR